MNRATLVAQSWSNTIKLHVGGVEFTTTKGTLTKQKRSYFDIIANGQWEPDNQGNFI